MPKIAYFSMEVALDPQMPTYSGGLGVLAGDTLKSAADLGVPMVGVTLLHRKGYVRQQIDPAGNQAEREAVWSPEAFMEPQAPSVEITIEGRPVRVKAWRYTVRGVRGHTVPVYFLDTALPENTAWDQSLTDRLYGGDSWYRLGQEIVLGIGGVAMLQALGEDVAVYHMNEGHSALLTLALLERQVGTRGLFGATDEDRDAVRARCVFTTHTPVPAGHDQFPVDLVRRALGAERADGLHAGGCCPEGVLNMTFLGMFHSRYINGVSHHHSEISRDMFPRYAIAAVTNGVHAATWTSPPFQRLYDRHLTPWRRDNHYLRYAVSIPLEEIEDAHRQAKLDLLAEVERRTRRRLDPAAMTVGFARRMTPYKRPALLFADLERLKRIARDVGPIQVIYAGKAHPRDEGGKEEIRRVFRAAQALGRAVLVVFLEEYDVALAGRLVAGVDLWLNTPQKPLEASGTSGMKAALNGVPSLSVLDGWWAEGHVEGVTGWAIGGPERESDLDREVIDLYHKLEHVIVPLFFAPGNGYAAVRRWCVALNGSFFNAQRMVEQYMENAYPTMREPTA